MDNINKLVSSKLKELVSKNKQEAIEQIVDVLVKEGVKLTFLPYVVTDVTAEMRLHGFNVEIADIVNHLRYKQSKE